MRPILTGWLCAILITPAAHAQPTPYDEPSAEKEAPAQPDAPRPEADAPRADPAPDHIPTPYDEPPQEDTPADPPDTPAEAPPPPPETVDPKLEEAKQLHKQGLTLLEAGDTERALAFFQRSRATFASAPNITNVAICLQRLGRDDEALEAYETLLTEYADQLAPEDRAAIAPTMQALLGKVASLWISANVAGTVLVDGRERGKLPLSQPLRVLAGRRVVRVLHPGHETFETTVEPRAKERVDVDASLKPLANVGIMRVEAPPGVAATVIIDGAAAGPAPWEGPVSPGAHVVQLVAGEFGSALTKVVVNQGQIALSRPAFAALGSEVTLRAEPRTALIEIDDLAVGSGAWSGRLPVGSYTVTAVEQGYLERSLRFESRVGDPVATLELSLLVDREHPRWPKPPAPSGDFWLGAYAGYAGATTLSSDAGASCPDACDGSTAAHGGMFGLRGGYRFPFGLSLEVGGGYAIVASRFARNVPASFGADGQHAVSYRIDDSLLMRGPYIAPSVSYRHPLTDWLSLEGRTTLGVFFAAATDDYGASATAGDTMSTVETANRDIARSVTIFVTPEIGAVAALGAIDLGLSLAVPIFPLAGPALDNGPIFPTAGGDMDNAGAAGNAPASNLTNGERAWDTFVMFSPQINAGYAF